MWGSFLCRRASHRTSPHIIRFGVWLVAASACGAGCGDGRSTVSGRITFNGQPIERGAITLTPVDGKGQTAGGQVAAGSYRIEGVQPGEKAVQIIAVYSMGRRKDDDGGEVEAMGDLLPASWGPGSKERMTVTAPSTTKDFAIEGPDPRKK